MNMPRNAYEIEQARRQYLQEGINRESLARIARAEDAKPGYIAQVENIFHHVLPHHDDSQPVSPVVKPVRRVANG